MFALFLLGIYPLWRLVRANQRTSLQYAAYWTVVAWAGWGFQIFSTHAGTKHEALDEIRFLALCLTAGVGVAVLGARRPHVGAWNFVVIGLLAVVLLPLAEHRILETPLFSGLRAWFVGGALFLAVLNYVPTRFALAAVLVGVACAEELVTLAAPEWYSQYRVAYLSTICLTLAPWAAFFRRPPHGVSDPDTLWLDFRDRYGLFWGLRVREQFNTAMKNAGVPARLAWSGLKAVPGSVLPAERQTCAALETLRALLKRFVPDG